MAKKALFHEIITRSGHGLHTHILPARRAEDLIELLQSDTVKVERSRSLGWKDVQIVICSVGVFFDSELGRYWYGDAGFEYLAEQFGPDYRAALRELN